MKTGGCLCGGVRYETTGPLRDITMCHCRMCRTQTGLYYAATESALDDFALTSDKTLTWYTSSEWAKRGFCSTCGTALFWKADEHDRISILVGSFDDDPGLVVGKQIFTRYKGAFYELISDIPTLEEGR
ncbi:MAG: GFA family protein [Acidimicrobiia bacterium]|nr:GFA family protein [Acidimicrobiia bacterium]NND14028.1 GFA family protein [Acidimicrobiia bacterium]